MRSSNNRRVHGDSSISLGEMHFDRFERLVAFFVFLNQTKPKNKKQKIGLHVDIPFSGY